MPIITVKELRKEYKVVKREEGLKGACKSLFKRQYNTVEAVKDIDFEINEGEIVGYLGSNGSGKTTTLKMLSGIIHPTSGSVLVDGFIPSDRKNEFKKKFAIVMGQKNQLWWDIPAKESFDLFSALYELDQKEYEERLQELVSMLGVEELIYKPVRNLSLGERMKMELIGSLLHNPKILFLDEPTIGLDIISQSNIREFLKMINKKYNTTILLTSHYMKDISDLCKRVIIINKGKKIYDDSLENLMNESSDEKIFLVSFAEDVPQDDFSQYGTVLSKEGNKLKLQVDNKNIREISQSLLSKYEIIDYQINEIAIELVLEKYFTV